MEPVENESAPTGGREENAAPDEGIESTAEIAPEERIETEEVFSEEMMVTGSDAGQDTARAELKAVIEAVIYITDEPLSAQQIAAALERPIEEINNVLAELSEDYQGPDRGLTIREVAGGYKMATKPEHHEPIRRFVKNLKPPLKLSLAALETLAVIAYKQPVTGPEILDIRGVQGGSVLKTLIERKLIAPAGRKAVVGKPILYKTTKEFLVQFGLKDLAELPTLKEFEELSRLALSDNEPESEPAPAPAKAEETNSELTREPTGQAAEEPAAEAAQPAEGPLSETGLEAEQHPAPQSEEEK